MGISRFLAWLRHVNKDNKFILKKVPGRVCNLMIDANGLAHDAAAKTFGYAAKDKDDEGKKEDLRIRKENESLSQTELALKYIKNLEKEFDDLIALYDPQDNFIICFDGVAPVAKLQQQKQRRFRPSSLPESVKFNTSSITPGTEFTDYIEKAMKGWLEKNKKKFKFHLNIVYSGFKVPGEGEHKIFQLFRDEEFVKSYDKSKNTVIVGKDADLVVLSVLSGIDNMYMVKDENQVLHIDELRNSILEGLSFEGSYNNRTFKDFAILVTFAGNDFLPTFPFFPGTDKMINFTFDIYRKLGKHLVDEKNNLNLENFKKFLTLIDERDYELYEEVYKTKLSFPIKEIKNYCGYKAGNFFMVDKNKFSKSWYMKEFSPKDPEGLFDVVKPDQRELIYDEDDINKMCENYVSCIQWNLYYYISGENFINKMFFYKYKHLPMLHDIIKYLNLLPSNRTIISNASDKQNEFTVTSLHQLILVLPQFSLELIPEKYLEEYGKVECLNPEMYNIDMEGVSQPWMSHPIIPNVNPRLVSYVLKDTKFGKYKNEKLIRIQNEVPHKRLVLDATRELKKETNKIKSDRKKGSYTSSRSKSKLDLDIIDEDEEEEYNRPVKNKYIGNDELL
jgi:5'-3' exonuclease